MIRPIVWVGRSKDDLSRFPARVKASFGLRLYELQLGRTPLDTRRLTQFGHGVHELRESFDGNAYRVVYVLALVKAIYVLHSIYQKIDVGHRHAATGC